MSRRGDREFLLDILEACNRIIDFTKDMSYDEFVKDIKTQDAVLRNIEIIGEAVKNISDKLKNRYSEIARVALFLASNLSSYIHGTLIIVDGGSYLPKFSRSNTRPT